MKVEQPGRRTWLWKDSLHDCELIDIVSGVPPVRLKKTYVRNCRGLNQINTGDRCRIILFRR